MSSHSEAPGTVRLVGPLRLGIALMALALTACMTPARDLDAAQAESRQSARAAIGSAADIDVQAHRQHLLGRPLTLDAAVALALAQQPRLAMAYSRLGIAAADAFEASRLANPTLSFQRLTGSGTQRSWKLGVDLADLLLLHQESELAERDFAALRIEVAAALIDVARDTESAWYRHVAAEQNATLRSSTAEAAEASALLARRLHEAGNISRLQLLREQAAAGEARIRALQAKAKTAATRRDLNLLMALQGEDGQRWQTPDTLPLPVSEEPELATLLAEAREHRLDLAAGQMQLSVLEDGRQLASRWGWLGSFDLDYEWERETDGSRLRGPGLTLELPIFHQGQHRRMRADARLMRGSAELAQRKLQVELDVRAAFAAVASQREVIQTYRAAIVPARAEAVERELERYNFMLIGTFELLTARQQEYQAYEDYIHAVRDYWLARTDLAHAVGRPLTGEIPGAEMTPDLRTLIHPETRGHDHHDHRDNHQQHDHNNHNDHNDHHDHHDHHDHRDHHHDHGQHHGEHETESAGSPDQGHEPPRHGDHHRHHHRSGHHHAGDRS
ncbi:MAG: TolC family protein [Gammaproteobacteria bacterium]|nr:TolC family protein [Gammaproteobacteria bacterium]